MYAKLGNICKTGTIAITSNVKFFLPDDPIYSKQEEKNYAISKDDNQGSYESKDTVPIVSLEKRHIQKKCCGN